MAFVDRDTICAVPTIGGILSDVGISKLHNRFPDSVLLPVSVRLHNEHSKMRGRVPSFVVVEYQGKGVAMLPVEAEALGLEEAPCWVPDLSGVKSIPWPEDFKKAGI